MKSPKKGALNSQEESRGGQIRATEREIQAM